MRGRPEQALYHLLSRTDWEQAQEQGRYAPASLVNEGFIHLSTASQVPSTAARYYGGRMDLLLLTVDAGQLVADVRWEEVRPGERFPHLYRALDLGMVAEAETYLPDDAGRFPPI